MMMMDIKCMEEDILVAVYLDKDVVAAMVRVDVNIMGGRKR
jgi:hypothetical protein